MTVLYLTSASFDHIVFTGIWDRWNMSFQPLLWVCMYLYVHSVLYVSAAIYVGVCVCVCVWLVPRAEWCPCWFCSSSSLSCSTQCVCLLGRLAGFSSVAPQRPSLLWGVKNFHLCISLDKKAPSPFESSSNTGRHCGHASLALISQILKPVCGEQDLRG